MQFQLISQIAGLWSCNNTYYFSFTKKKSVNATFHPLQNAEARRWICSQAGRQSAICHHSWCKRRKSLWKSWGELNACIFKELGSHKLQLLIFFHTNVFTFCHYRTLYMFWKTTFQLTRSTILRTSCQILFWEYLSQSWERQRQLQCFSVSVYYLTINNRISVTSSYLVISY